MGTLEDELDAWLRAGGGRSDVAATIARLATACIRLAHLIGQGPLAERSMPDAGERRARLEGLAHGLMVEALRDAPVATMLSEQVDNPVTLAAAAPLAVAIDALDGSANLDGNGPLGTIFSLLPALAGDPDGAYRRPGMVQLAAGIALYGPSTALALTLGEGTVVFTLDRNSGQFRRNRASVSIPMGRPEYAIDASSYRHWAAAIRAYIDDCVAGAEGPCGEDFDMRWVGSLAAEAFRILVRGGVCLCPADARPGHGHGLLRLVCQANPIALVTEQAGGAATDGTRRVLELVPESPRQRTPLVFGSRDNVERVQRYHEDPPFAAHRAPLFGQRGLFRV